MASTSTCTENDLPLMSNSSDILVHHFILDLTCHFDKKIFEGSIILFLDPSLNAEDCRHVFSIQEFQQQAQRTKNQLSGKDRNSPNTHCMRIDSHKSPKEHSTKPKSNSQHQAEGITSKNCVNSSGDMCIDSQNTSNDLIQETSKSDVENSTYVEGGDGEDFMLILDSYDIDVCSVEEICLPESVQYALSAGYCQGLNEVAQTYLSCREYSGCPLEYMVDRWSLKVWKEGVSKPAAFPKCVKVKYNTRPDGASLRWALDQDEKPCVYSAAMWVNNRALLPCQEYGSLATWQAHVTAPTGVTVLLSADTPGTTSPTSDGWTEHHFYCSMPLPSFTLALALGHWETAVIHRGTCYTPDSCQVTPRTSIKDDSSEIHQIPSYLKPTCCHADPCHIYYTSTPILPCRVVAPPSLLPRLQSGVTSCLSQICKAVQEILGPSPFPRLDIMLYPACSQDMAFASPCLVMLSQSLLQCDLSERISSTERNMQHPSTQPACGVANADTTSINSIIFSTAKIHTDKKNCHETCNSVADFQCTIATANMDNSYTAVKCDSTQSESITTEAAHLRNCSTVSNCTGIPTCVPDTRTGKEMPLSLDGSACGMTVCGVKNSALCVRLGHELCHYWFGLLLGARDWTEEWLSEGFATFLEDVVYGCCRQWSSTEYEAQSELRASIRHSLLKAEVTNMDTDLQTLRPNKGESQVVDPVESGRSQMYVKNGMNANKLFSQLHYLKGYFLLRYLSERVGVEEFLTMFRSYIIKHHGEMVTSQNFLDMVFQTFPRLRESGLDIEILYRDWLDTPGIPQALSEFALEAERNPLYKQVLEQVALWLRNDRANRRKSVKRRRRETQEYAQLETVQLLLVLDRLLDCKTLAPATLRQLRAVYGLHEATAEVRHRWSEMVVKHQYSGGYLDLQHFLLCDQAMGVYLYGEMMLSGNDRLITLARQCLTEIQPQMDSSTYQAVHQMLYGT